MTIRFHGLMGLAEETAIATSIFSKHGYYFLRGGTILFVPEDEIVSRCYPYGLEEPPTIKRFIEDWTGDTPLQYGGHHIHGDRENTVQ